MYLLVSTGVGQRQTYGTRNNKQFQWTIIGLPIMKKTKNIVLIADVDIHLYSQLLLVNIKLRIRVMSSPSLVQLAYLEVSYTSDYIFILILIILFFCNMMQLRNNKSIYLLILFFNNFQGTILLCIFVYLDLFC